MGALLASLVHAEIDTELVAKSIDFMKQPTNLAASASGTKQTPDDASAHVRFWDHRDLNPGAKGHSAANGLSS
jgi:hypothetical protein